MRRQPLFRKLVLFFLLPLTALTACTVAATAELTRAVPAPKVDMSLTAKSGAQTAVFAGGCFWGLQWVFEHVKGVTNVAAGYSGGAASTAQYERVSEGDTGHAESVKVTFDPAKVSYGQLLHVYFSVATDPTQLNRQGPDTGTQYRGVIFYSDTQQKNIASAYIAQLAAARVYPAPIVTQIVPLRAFYPAENYHQDYARLNPDAPYIVVNDAPKVKHLQQLLPELYRAQPVVYRPQSETIPVQVM